MNAPVSKASKVRAAMAAGDWQEAIRIAARFPDLGEFKAVITRAHGCYTNPGFYQQLGFDCEAVKAEARAAMLARYGAQ